MLSTLPFWLHTVALALQLIGAVLVIREVRSTVATFTRFRASLADAEQAKEDHREHIRKNSGRQVPGFNGGKISLPVIQPEAAEALVEQAGPGAAKERQAIQKFVEEQFHGTGWSRWAGVTLVIIGAVVGYGANVSGL